ncbi:MAG: PilZ domain-containing protein [Candidatus Abyssobacteria bacterium SURF_17]|uniref:PilZ domain-containing protein n=1 Tax=Candidatus Abyssobacteria bacterium SURF_17 TaxID=2093361 RepID=A0A419F079_9BACT|nr:MAG: PilZ domain-containing protein [Candidatus Abyssubacteria bacterium SURF_17]
MRIATNMALKSGEIVRFELPLFRELGFGEKAGKVVWISKNDGEGPYAFQAGFDFVDVTRAERDRLRKWIFAAEIAGRARKASLRRGSDMGPVIKG